MKNGRPEGVRKRKFHGQTNEEKEKKTTKWASRQSKEEDKKKWNKKNN